MTSPTPKNPAIDSQGNTEENKSNFVVSTVSADGLAPTGAGAPAGKVKTKSFGSGMKC